MNDLLTCPFHLYIGENNSKYCGENIQEILLVVDDSKTKPVS